MKNTIFKLFLLALLFSNCSKSRDDAGTGSRGNTWVLGKTVYTAASVNYQITGTQAVLSTTAVGSTATSFNSLAFNFWTLPIDGQQLPITNTSGPATMMITATKMANAAVKTYSNKANQVKATVSILNNKVSVIFRDTIWMYNNNIPTDSLQLSADIITQD